MSSDDSRIRRVSKPAQVDISSIDKELSNLWESESRRISGQNEPPLARVCTLNLIVYAADKDSLDIAIEAADKAAGSNPSRSIFLLAEGDTQDGPTVNELSGYCRLIEGGGVQICCEQITLTAKGESISELASSATELLSPDLPVALWWTSDLDLRNESFELLESVSDRLILDSRNFHNPDAEFRHMVYLAKEHLHTAISDINWLRITPWREEIAELFDPINMRNNLSTINEIKIEYSRGDIFNTLQSALLAGWISSRLKWDYISSVNDTKTGKITCCMLDQGDRNINIAISPVTADRIYAGDMVSVSLQCNQDKDLFTLSADPGKSSLLVSQKIGDLPVMEVNHGFTPQSMGDLLVPELTVMSADAVYYEALFAANDILTQRSSIKDTDNIIW
ncbi:MAG: glucose-6-phosphate dehydrogenase assembly protein OpcA [Armatimonadota bacterium]